MKTTVIISENVIQVSVSGITVSINSNELFAGLQTLKALYHNVIPAKHKSEFVGCGIDYVLERLEKFEPLAKQFLQSWKVSGDAKSEITFNEDGTIQMWSNEQNATFDLKNFMQCIADFSDLMEEEDIKPVEPMDLRDLNLWVLADLVPATPWNISENTDLEAQEIIDFLYSELDVDIQLDETLNRREMVALAKNFKEYTWAITGDNEVTITRKMDSTDQVTGDNKIVFTKRPTNPELMRLIENKTGSVILWHQFTERFYKQTGMSLDPKLSASTSICITACNVYGLEAVCEFNNVINHNTDYPGKLDLS